MNLFRRVALASAGVMTAAAMVAAGTGAASASATSARPAAQPASTDPPGHETGDYNYFGLDYNGSQVRSYAQGQGNAVLMPEVASGSLAWTNWYMPIQGSSYYGQFIQANSELCMELDHAAGNTIIESGCNASATYQQWRWTSTDELQSEWDPSLCMAYDKANVDLYAISCSNSSYEHFAVYSG